MDHKRRMQERQTFKISPRIKHGDYFSKWHSEAKQCQIHAVFVFIFIYFLRLQCQNKHQKNIIVNIVIFNIVIANIVTVNIVDQINIIVLLHNYTAF